jgi:hypothetical protein
VLWRLFREHSEQLPAVSWVADPHEEGLANPLAKSILTVIGATADRGGHVIIGVGFAPCGNSKTDLFPSGSGINFIVRLDIKSRTCSGSCMATFTMKG